ncbi:hypothetical protein AMJ80_02865 [bacterium SM23_31]|nr:MAG: hypothetical protein AMJ80_02865 [bacterium SM23_31]
MISSYPHKDFEKYLIIHIYNNNGKLLRQFLKPKIFDFQPFNLNGNLINFTIDENDNIYVVFYYQNRIEKYSPEGKLFMKIDRPLDFKLIHKKKTRKLSSGEIVETPDMMRVSEGIGVDHKWRIWVVTYRKQRTEEEPELFKFDILDNEGVYLGSLPADEYKYTENIQKMKIHGDRLFIIDTYEEMCLYEYRIVEK